MQLPKKATDSPSRTSSRTKPNKFRPWNGIWVITQAGQPDLVSNVFRFSSEFGFRIQRFRNEAFLFGSEISKKGRVNRTFIKPKFPLEYFISSNVTPGTTSFGESGKINFEMGNTEGLSFMATVRPETEGVAQSIQVTAERIEAPFLPAKIVTKVKRKGKAKPGSTLTLLYTIINRGKAVVLPGHAEFSAVISKPFINLDLVATPKGSAKGSHLFRFHLYAALSRASN